MTEKTHKIPAIIVDIDGTVADVAHRRHHLPHSWDKFFADMDKDPQIEPVCDLVKLLSKDYYIIFCSSRPEDYREVTETWLSKQGLHQDNPSNSCLLMRKSRDYRRDDIVKKEILDSILERNTYEIAFVIDDRPEVVKMWRRNGLTCFQCADWEPEATVGTDKSGLGDLHLLVGPSGAGKTTYAEKMKDECYVLSSDHIRQLICGDFRDQNRNGKVFQVLHDQLSSLIYHGINVVVDTTNMRKKSRETICNLVPKHCKIFFHIIDRPLEDKLRDGGWRLKVNTHGMNLIEWHHQRFGSCVKDILRGDKDSRVIVYDKRT